MLANSSGSSASSSPVNDAFDPAGSSILREARLFRNGRSQAVRLPADCRFEGESVYVKKWRGSVVLLQKGNAWQPLLDAVGMFSADFMVERDQGLAQDRRDDPFGA